jgi:hypothetical protein
MERARSHRTFDSERDDSAPSAIAAALERARDLHSESEIDLGYAVWGLSFASGAVLALRRYPPSPRSTGYTCVWHRRPDGLWTFYADVGDGGGCHRHFGSCVDRLVVAPIRVEWTAPFRFLVTIDGGRGLCWSMQLASSLATTVTSACLRLVPRSVWCDDRKVRLLAALTSVSLRAGRLPLAVHAPSGHRFLLRPHSMWRVVASRASVLGRDLGPLIEPTEQATLGDFVIPRSGLFVVGGGF